MEEPDESNEIGQTDAVNAADDEEARTISETQPEVPENQEQCDLRRSKRMIKKEKSNDEINSHSKRRRQSTWTFIW